MTLIETEEGVAPPVAQTLRIIALAMGSGLALMAGLVVWSYLNVAAKAPTLTEVASINTLTTLMMVLAVAVIIASEILWRRLLRKSPGTLSARVSTAFIVRLACREGAGLLGLTAAYLAAISGVLHVYPAYWVNLAPFVLFLGFLATHWPSAEKLTAEAREILASGL